MSKRRLAQRQKVGDWESSSTIVSIQPDKKQWSKFDLCNVTPLTEAQQKAFKAWANGRSLLLSGTAGTGKSFLAIYLALQYMLSNPASCEKLVIIRSAVPTRDVGALPGTLEEKLAVYQAPYAGIFDELFKFRKTWENMKKAGKVEFHATSYLRGTTISNAVVIIDEAQSQTMHELSTVITRLGDNSRLIVCGDTKQNDLLYKKSDVSGFRDFCKILDSMPEMSHILFTRDDIVRSEFVKSFIEAAENLGL